MAPAKAHSFSQYIITELKMGMHGFISQAKAAGFVRMKSLCFFKTLDTAHLSSCKMNVALCKFFLKYDNFAINITEIAGKKCKIKIVLFKCLFNMFVSFDILTKMFWTLWLACKLVVRLAV